MTESRLRTFIAHVEDLPGVLNRVTSLFRRRGYNIASLAVGRTHEAGVSRMTLVIDADDDGARRVEANLYKLVNVLRVEDTTARATVARELALVKVRADAQSRPSVMQICDVFRARVVDVAPEALICEITGHAGKIDGFVDVLAAFGVVEMVRTGAVAMMRSAEPPARDVSDGRTEIRGPDVRDAPDASSVRDVRDALDVRDAPSARDASSALEVRDAPDARDAWSVRDGPDVRDASNARDALDPHDPPDVRDARDARDAAA